MKRNYPKTLLATLLLLCSTVASAQEISYHFTTTNCTDSGRNLIWNSDLIEFNSPTNGLRITMFENNSGAGTNEFNGFPIIALGELEFYDGDGNKIDYTANDVTTNSLESSEGSLAGLCDGNYSTFYHSTWLNGSSPSDYVYLDIEFPREIAAVSIKMVSRSTKALVPTYIGITNYGTRCITPKCGNNVFWTFANNILTISGTGNMKDYKGGNSPWDEYRYTEIKEVIVEEGIEHIGRHAFFGFYVAEKVTLPTTLRTIGEHAFTWCDSLESITIPENVTSIGENAFYNCRSLRSATIPNSVTTIGEEAFARCSSLESIKVESGNTIYDSRDNCNAIIETATSKLIAGCKKTVIPNSVTTIGEKAFSQCDSLESIIIPNSITTIGHGAFWSCSSLKSVTIPNSVTTIENIAFAGCSSLESVTIPNSATNIGGQAFESCTSLESITIPNSVKTIGNAAFQYCSNLASIKVESGNTIYDSRDNCNAIIETATSKLIAGCKNTVIPNSVTTIEYGAFAGCTSLESITIPNSVTTIENFAFAECTSLESITIPNSITTIGNYAFAWCTSLENIVSHIPAENLFTIDSNVFILVDKNNCTLYVPAGAKEIYATTNGWKDFTNIVEIEAETPQEGAIRGDVNNDGIVDVADITEIVDIILNGNK